MFVAECTDHPVWVHVTNEGNARWPGGEGREPNIRVGAYWRALDGSSRVEAGRVPLTHLLDPGDTTLVSALIPAPPHDGPIEPVIDLVHEDVRWFDCGLTLRANVQPSPQERLDDLAARHGPLVPVAVVLQERRAVARPNGLLRPESTGGRLADERLDELTRDLPRGTWALDGPTIDRMVEVVRDVAPRAVVEFGSGTSTVVLAALLRELYVDGWPRIVSFEHDTTQRHRTRAALTERGLAGVAEVIHTPLGSAHDRKPRCYLLDDAAASILRRHPPELVLVDGPPLYSGASRVGTLDLVAPFLQRDAIVLLDDALRDAELCIAAVWQRRSDLTVHGIRPTSAGLLEATLHHT